MKYGWITSNITDILAKPMFNSERLSQLLMADLVEIKNETKGYLKIVKHDGYRGYCNVHFVKPLLKKEYFSYLMAKKHFVKSMTANLNLNESNKPAIPYFIFYGTEVKANQAKNKMKIILPDNSKYFLSSAHLTPMNKRKPIISGAVLIKEAKRLLGVPYLWGGISSFGIDCSGLVQTVCRRYGIDVPRDTKDQIKSGVKINRDEIKAGDLMFFKRHVGFAIDRNQLIHSTVGGGGVRINSLDKSDSHYREDLEQNFNQVRRIL